MDYGCGGALGAGTVSATYLYRAFRAAVELGARKPVLLAETGIDERDLRNPLSRLSGLILVRLIEAAERELRDPAAALRMGALFGPRSLSDMGYVARFQPTLAAAFDYNRRTLALSQTLVEARLDRGRIHSRIVFDMIGPSAPVLRPYLELLLSHWRQSAIQAAGRPAALVSVSLPYDAPPHAADYARHFGCPIQFGASAVTCEFATELLDAPLPLADLALSRRMEQRLAIFQLLTDGRIGEGTDDDGVGPFSRMCRAYLLGEMDKSSLTLSRTAEALGTSERSLRRRIRDEGTSFRAILEHVRRELCDVYLLERGRSMEEIALLLGYSETSAFTRAHCRWYGVPPSRVQRSLRAVA